MQALSYLAVFVFFISACSQSNSEPTEDVISFGPEEFDYSLTKDANQIQMSLQNNPNCTNGELKLELTSTTIYSK